MCLLHFCFSCRVNFRLLFLYSLFFFFYCYGAHRDLHVLTHSFPTRRSSDLKPAGFLGAYVIGLALDLGGRRIIRSEEHTSELQSLRRISYAVFCLKTKKSGSEFDEGKEFDEELHISAKAVSADLIELSWEIENCYFLYNIFFFNDTATTEIYTYCHTLSLHDALPIPPRPSAVRRIQSPVDRSATSSETNIAEPRSEEHTSELQSLRRISYAVFCLKKKKKHNTKHKIQEKLKKNKTKKTK